MTELSKPARLQARGVDLAYRDSVVSRDLTIAIPDGEMTMIVGPNACGKSTALRALARMLEPTRGVVVLDGRSIHELPTKEVAREVGLLPQTNIAPEGMSVRELVACGRYPHQRLLHRWSREDEDAVNEALALTVLEGLEGRAIDSLSGGQRQRAWIAMVLAQKTGLLLLDEPTTYLDLSHQIELLDLCRDLNERHGRTVAVVLHDLGQAARYATNLLVMSDGQLVASGHPRDVLTAELVEEVFGVRCVVIDDPISGTPLVVPLARDAVARGRRGTGDETLADGDGEGMLPEPSKAVP